MNTKRNKNLPDLSEVKPKMSLEKAREILGKTAEKMSDEELQEQMVLIEYLVESWLDDFEKTIFEGKTLKEHLNEV